MKNSVNEGLASRTSAAARDGGTKRTLVDAGTCVYCGVNPVRHELEASLGHRREVIGVCEKCFTVIPLQKILSVVFGIPVKEVSGARFFPQAYGLVRRPRQEVEVAR